MPHRAQLQLKLKRWIGRLKGYFPYALPIGSTDFDRFCQNIFFIYDIPDMQSYREAIATMILHQPPTKPKKSLHWFERCIRKAQANQVAFEKLQEFKKQAAQPPSVEATITQISDAG